MLDIGLKEWAGVCHWMGEGRWSILLRKGGIHEQEGPGRFVLEHPRFVLFPSWLHQKVELLRPEFRSSITRQGSEPEDLTLSLVGEVFTGCIAPVRTRQQLDALADLHGWTQEQVDMRWHYKPENPLYALAVRVYRLANPRTIPNRPAYGGCRSWVPLAPGDAVEDTSLQPVLSEGAFASVRERLNQALT